MDIFELVAELTYDGTFPRIMQNPLAQFGIPARRYIGAELLPEVTRDVNMFREDNVQYRTIVANNGTRYGPVQRKKGVLTGYVDVILAESDIGSEFTSREYEALRKLLQRNDSMAATSSLINFVDRTVNRPLIERNEVMRWQAIVNAQVNLVGVNEYTEAVTYTNPSGHRVVAAAAWSTTTTDPYADIVAGVEKLRDEGYGASRFITSQKVANIMRRNPLVAARTGRASIDTTGKLVGIPGMVTMADLNGLFGADGLPPIETYDLKYRTTTGTARFLPDDVFVIVSQTGRDERLDLADQQLLILPETLGYLAVGTPAGQDAPGRALYTEAFLDKPPRIDAQGWQTSLPVITEPNAIFVISGIS